MIPPATEPPAAPRPPGRGARLAASARRLMVAGLLAMIALGALGQVVRDRSVAWALLMDLPLPLIGVAAVWLDLVCRGRAWRLARGRFALAAVGLATTLGGSLPLLGPGVPGRAEVGTEASPARAARASRPASVLQWNVVWGGGRRRNPAHWAEIRRTIAARRADVIVLSEAPPDEWLDEVVGDLGPTGSRVQVENEPGTRYWFKLVVASAAPVRLVDRPTVRNGTAMAVEVRVDDRAPGPLRLLVVDGLSSPRIDRTPFLRDVAELCSAASAAGRPFDLVLGDFNSMARSVGFDALGAAGYAPAPGASRAWRGTFPSIVPVYDIDHVWVHRGRWPEVRWDPFTNLASDHRGQVVTLRPPGD